MDKTGAVVVSPHRDDAVMSAWSVIDDSSLELVVVNVFTGSPAPGRLFEWDEGTDAPDSATRMNSAGKRTAPPLRSPVARPSISATSKGCTGRRLDGRRSASAPRNGRRGLCS